MILPYLARLVCLCLASFFLVHLLAGVAVAAITPWAVRRASQIEPARGARWLLALRLLPSLFALLVVAGLCAPSYLYLEPRESLEETGWTCLIAAALGFAVCARSLVRAGRAILRSARHFQNCRQHGREMRFPQERTPVWVIDGSAPRVMLAGLLRPRMVISRNVVDLLSAEQLSAVVGHERAHGASHDNMKRLATLLAPEMLPWISGYAALDRAWAKITEWAADDRASEGEARRSLALAAALVRVARLGSPPAAPALIRLLMADAADLSERVDRLLRPIPSPAVVHEREPILAASAGLLLAAGFLALLAHPMTLQAAHDCLEFLI